MINKLINLAGFSLTMMQSNSAKGHKIPRRRLWWVGIILYLSSSIVLAEQNWYQIELIVFEQTGPNSELFNQTESAIAWPKKLLRLDAPLISLEELILSPVTNTRLQYADYLLNNTYGELRRKADYKPLLHIAWFQSALGNRLSDAVHLYKRTEVDEYKLNGFVRLQRGHYLHLLVDLEYKPMISTPDYDDESEDSAAIIYHLTEKRRIKLNEIHYLDHPKFGVIATVKPIAISKTVQ